MTFSNVDAWPVAGHIQIYNNVARCYTHKSFAQIYGEVRNLLHARHHNDCDCRLVSSFIASKSIGGSSVPGCGLADPDPDVLEIQLDVSVSAAMTSHPAPDASTTLEFLLSPRSPGNLLVFMDSERSEDPHPSDGGDRGGKLESSNERFSARLMPRRDSFPISESPAPRTISKCLAIADILLESLNLNEVDVHDRDFAPLNYALSRRMNCSRAPSRQSNESNASASTDEDGKACSQVHVADVGETKQRLEDQIPSDRSGSTTKFLKRRWSEESARKSLLDHVWSMEVRGRFVQRHESASSAVSSITNDSCSYQEPKYADRGPFQYRIPSRRAMSFGTLPHKLECDLDSALESSHLSGDSPPRSPRRSVSFSFDDTPETVPTVSAA